MEFLIAAVTAFLLVVPVELPDKTFVATLVLSTRYRPLPVWIGVAIAFGIQSLVAVAAGHLVTLLPDRPVQLVAAALFAVGGFVLFASAGRAVVEERQREREYEGKVKNVERSGLSAAFASFGVLFVAEWGDLSQLLTAGLVARGMAAGRGVRRLVGGAGRDRRGRRGARAGAAAVREPDRHPVRRRRGLCRSDRGDPAQRVHLSDRGQTVTRGFPARFGPMVAPQVPHGREKSRVSQQQSDRR